MRARRRTRSRCVPRPRGEEPEKKVQTKWARSVFPASAGIDETPTPQPVDVTDFNRQWHGCANRHPSSRPRRVAGNCRRDNETEGDMENAGRMRRPALHNTPRASLQGQSPDGRPDETPDGTTPSHPADGEVAVRRRPLALRPRCAPPPSAVTLSAIPQPRPIVVTVDRLMGSAYLDLASAAWTPHFLVLPHSPIRATRSPELAVEVHRAPQRRTAVANVAVNRHVVLRCSSMVLIFGGVRQPFHQPSQSIRIKVIVQITLDLLDPVRSC